MWQYIVKVILTAVVVVLIASIAKRSTFWSAALASLPLTSLLAFVWLYIESGSAQRVADLSQSIFWFILPSLTVFILLPVLLRAGVGFWLSLGVSSAATAAAYFAMSWILVRFGIRT